MSTIAKEVIEKTNTDLDKLKHLLSDYPALVENADEACWAMLSSANMQLIEKDTLLYQEGMECSQLMLIIEGRVRVYKNSIDGREVTLYRAEPGQLCINNLNNLLDGASYPVVARADTRVRGLVITRKAFHTALEASNSFRNYVLRNLTERLTHMANLISGFAFDRLDLRVGCWLMDQFEHNKSHSIEMTHSDLAHELGTTREMISRILKDFEHKRCIQLSRGKIHLVCKNTLHLISEGKGKIRKDFVA